MKWFTDWQIYFTKSNSQTSKIFYTWLLIQYKVTAFLILRFYTDIVLHFIHPCVYVWNKTTKYRENGLLENQNIHSSCPVSLYQFNTSWLAILERKSTHNANSAISHDVIKWPHRKVKRSDHFCSVSFVNYMTYCT